jgi:hypothetical protein
MFPAKGHPSAALEHGNRLIENVFKVHQPASMPPLAP